VRYFFRRRLPHPTRILLIESGSRHLIEGLLPHIRQRWGEVPIDLVTCYGGLPRGLEPENTKIYRTGDYRGGEGRRRLFRELAGDGHSIMGVLCSAEPVLFKWKCALIARLPVKVLVANENGDYFWLDWGHWQAIQHFILFRAGLTGPEAVRTLARLVLFPFTLIYLLLYASTVHFRRVLRRGYR